MSLVRRERGKSPLDVRWPEDRIDRAFREMLRAFFTGGVLVDRFAGGWGGAMHLEEYTEDGTYVIRAELPGLDPDKDVDIHIDDGVLHVHASREERHEDKRDDSYHSEFHYGSFDRAVRLPESAIESDVSAAYSDGILEIRVPVPEPQKEPVKVAIKH